MQIFGSLVITLAKLLYWVCKDNFSGVITSSDLDEDLVLYFAALVVWWIICIVIRLPSGEEPEAAAAPAPDRPQPEPEPEPEPEPAVPINRRSRTASLISAGSMDSFRKGKERIAECKAVLKKMDIRDIPDGSADREQFERDFAKEIRELLSILIVQKMDEQGVATLNRVVEKAEEVV